MERLETALQTTYHITTILWQILTIKQKSQRIMTLSYKMNKSYRMFCLHAHTTNYSFIFINESLTI